MEFQMRPNMELLAYDRSDAMLGDLYGVSIFMFFFAFFFG